MAAPVITAEAVTIAYILVLEKVLAGTGWPRFTVEAYHKDGSHLLIGIHATIANACREATNVGHAADCHEIRLCLTPDVLK